MVCGIGGGSGGGGFSPPPNFWKILLTDRFLPAKTHEKVDWAPPRIDKVTWAPPTQKSFRRPWSVAFSIFPMRFFLAFGVNSIELRYCIPSLAFTRPLTDYSVTGAMLGMFDWFITFPSVGIVRYPLSSSRSSSPTPCHCFSTASSVSPLNLTRSNASLTLLTILNFPSWSSSTSTNRQCGNVWQLAPVSKGSKGCFSSSMNTKIQCHWQQPIRTSTNTSSLSSST